VRPGVRHAGLSRLSGGADAGSGAAQRRRLIRYGLIRQRCGRLDGRARRRPDLDCGRSRYVIVSPLRARELHDRRHLMSDFEECPGLDLSFFYCVNISLRIRAICPRLSGRLPILSAVSGLPSPEDIMVKVLFWLGTSAVIVMIFTSCLAVAGWLSLGRSSVRYVRIGARRAGETVRDWTSARQRAMVRLLAASTGFVAVSYSLSQLAGITYEKLGPGRQPLSSGVTPFDAGFLMSQLLEYQHFTRFSIWTVAGVLASIFMLNFANLIDAHRLRNFIRFIARIVLGTGLAVSVLVVLNGLGVLVEGLNHQNNFKPSMVVLYALWAVCLWLLPCFAVGIDGASEKTFSVSTRITGSQGQYWSTPRDT
jgi:hypothetical protein